VERQVLMSGIGGQGVQLAAQILARAGAAEGRDVQLFGSYGGMMRGGNTEATVVLADDEVQAPPTVDAAWGLVLAHPEHAAGCLARWSGEGPAVLDAAIWGAARPEGGPVLALDAGRAASEAGHAQAAVLVLLGALARATGLVGPDALQAAAEAAVPPYRDRLRAVNAAALVAGAALVPSGAPAWPAPIGGGVR
jgi:Pyruvate/2-oxoacid:ferredoxin oxidoreductase gamma subunit